MKYTITIIIIVCYCLKIIILPKGIRKQFPLELFFACIAKHNFNRITDR
jgi:hypothetical protein